MKPAQSFAWMILLWILACSAARPADPIVSDPLASALNGLTAKSFAGKGEAIDTLVEIPDSRVYAILQALLNGRLYYFKKDRRIVIVQPARNNYRALDPLADRSLGIVGKGEIQRIIINNQLRQKLRAALASLSLSSKDPAQRLSAVDEISKAMDSKAAALLREHLQAETAKPVIEAIHSALAQVDIDSDDKAVRLEAIATLGKDLSPEARNRLSSLLEKNPNGTFVESDPEIRKAAKSAIKKIESRLQFYRFLETGFFGLSLGSVLVLAAIGLAITFGVMGVINMAHGELIMLGAYTTYVVQQLMPDKLDGSLFVAIPAAFLVTALFGIAIERGIIRFLYGRPLESLLATFGVSLVLQQLVRSVFSPLNRSVTTPSWMSGSLEINSALSLTLNRLSIIVFTLVVFALLLLILKKTRLGLQVRAVAQNRPMAKAMGVRTEWVDAMTFGLGSGIAGLAGVALSQLTNVGPNLGQAYIVDSFMVVVFGGVGNLWGTLVGGFSLGVANKFLEPHAGAVLAKILLLVFIIVFIQKRPRGLFPQKGRAAEA